MTSLRHNPDKFYSKQYSNLCFSGRCPVDYTHEATFYIPRRRRRVLVGQLVNKHRLFNVLLTVHLSIMLVTDHLNLLAPELFFLNFSTTCI